MKLFDSSGGTAGKIEWIKGDVQQAAQSHKYEYRLLDGKIGVDYSFKADIQQTVYIDEVSRT